jgi:hypothetical protein
VCECGLAQEGAAACVGVEGAWGSAGGAAAKAVGAGHEPCSLPGRDPQGRVGGRAGVIPGPHGRLKRGRGPLGLVCTCRPRLEPKHFPTLLLCGWGPCDATLFHGGVCRASQDWQRDAKSGQR